MRSLTINYDNIWLETNEFFLEKREKVDSTFWKVVTYVGDVFFD